MPKILQVRAMTDEERKMIEHLSRSRTAPARQVERARMVQWASEQQRVPQIATRLGVAENTVRNWLHRFNEAGLPGLLDEARTGRPPTYNPDEVSDVVATALSKPDTLGLPFGHWTLDRLEVYLNEEKGIAIKRSRISEILQAEGLRWRKDEHWFWRTGRSRLRQKKGLITTLYTAPPERSAVVNLDEMGPESAKSFLGKKLVYAQPAAEKGKPAERASQEIDYGRRAKGYIFGAFQPATGSALTRPYDRRTTEKLDRFSQPS